MPESFWGNTDLYYEPEPATSYDVKQQAYDSIQSYTPHKQSAHAVPATGGIRSLEADDRNTDEHQNPYDQYEHTSPEWAKPNNMILEIIPLNDVTREFYSKHGTQHHRDAGLDLVFPVESIIPAKSHGCRIPLGIKARAVIDGTDQPFMLFSRSSIFKTPIRLSNPPGLIDPTCRGELKK